MLLEGISPSLCKTLASTKRKPMHLSVSMSLLDNLALQAIQDNNTKVVQAWLLYNKRRPNRNRIKDRHGFAPVHYAVKFNRLQLLEDLCKDGNAGK